MVDEQAGKMSARTYDVAFEHDEEAEPTQEQYQELVSELSAFGLGFGEFLAGLGELCAIDRIATQDWDSTR